MGELFIRLRKSKLCFEIGCTNDVNDLQVLQNTWGLLTFGGSTVHYYPSKHFMRFQQYQQGAAEAESNANR